MAVRIVNMKPYDVTPLRGYHPEIGILLASLEDSTREWRENLGDISVEAITWQPAPGSYSVGALILHLIDCEFGWFNGFAAGNPQNPKELKLLMSAEVDQENGIWPVPPSEPIEWYYGLHDQFRARAFDALRGIEPERTYERKSFGCTLRWVVAHVLEHDSYTGGQAVAMHELWKKLK